MCECVGVRAVGCGCGGVDVEVGVCAAHGGADCTALAEWRAARGLALWCFCVCVCVCVCGCGCVGEWVGGCVRDIAAREHLGCAGEQENGHQNASILERNATNRKRGDRADFRSAKSQSKWTPLSTKKLPSFPHTWPLTFGLQYCAAFVESARGDPPIHFA